MVEDNQIKAQVSPFAIREGEIKTFDGKDGYVSMNQIINKINYDKKYGRIMKRNRQQGYQKSSFIFLFSIKTPSICQHRNR